MSERDQPKPEDRKELPVQPETALAPPPLGDAALEPELQAFIGRQLQAAHDEILNEPVPDRFIKLLQDLEQGKVGKP